MPEQQDNTHISLSSILQDTFPVIITDVNGIITSVNEKFCNLSKYNKEELIGEYVGILQPKELGDLSFSRKLQMTDSQFIQEDTEYVDKNGQFFWGQATTISMRNRNDEITHYVSFIIDTTKTDISKNKYIQAIEDLRNIENALNESTVVAITNRQGVITYVNKKFCELSKYEESELLGQTHTIVNSGHHSREFFKDLWRTIGTGYIWEGDIKNRAKDGSYYWVHTRIIPVKNKNGKPQQYISIRTDITARIEAETSLQKALQNDFHKTVKNLHNIIFKYRQNEDNEIVFTLIEGKMAKHLGLTLEHVTMKSIATYYKPKELKSIKENLMNAIHGNATQFEVAYEKHTFLLYLSPIIENGVVVEVVGTVHDLTKRKNAEMLVEKMAYYDFLTGLPNRRLLQQEIETMLMQHKKTNENFAFMFIDLDRFKNINDSLGHSAGDQLLVQFSDRLKNVVQDDGMVIRFGGDEFIVLLPQVTPEKASIFASNITESLSQSYTLNNLEMFINVSIGISLYPKDGQDFDTLLSKADIAMFEGKKLGEDKFQFFTEEMHHDLLEQTILEMELRQAVEKGQFELFYQPQKNLSTGQLTGVEALIRWKHPTKGFIPPNVFIPLAEETGIISKIGSWVLETACRQLKEWQNNDFPFLKMSVNISIVQFEHPLFVERVTQTLKDAQLDPSYLNLEITESMTLNHEKCQVTLHQLRKLGVEVSIDDFGTGYSSLSYLSQFPITHLKIDQFFIHELTKSNRTIVKTIIQLAKSLNVKVVAEGVEKEEHEQFLKELNCDEVQGYYYARPMQVKQVEDYMKNVTDVK